MSSLRESLERALAEKEARAAKLQSTLDDWGDDEAPSTHNVYISTAETKGNIVTTSTTPLEQHTPSPINISVSQQTFEHIKANPGITARQAVIDLSATGLNIASTTSLISQMVRTGMCKREDQKLFMQVKYYRPIQMVKKAKPKHKQVTIITRPQPQEAATAAGIATLTKPNVAHNVKSLLDEISVNEARALYLELKTMFGGN